MTFIFREVTKKKKRGKTAKKSASPLTNLFAFSSTAEPDDS